MQSGGKVFSQFFIKLNEMLKKPPCDKSLYFKSMPSVLCKRCCILLKAHPKKLKSVRWLFRYYDADVALFDIK
jgi:hypothetical protein